VGEQPSLPWVTFADGPGLGRPLGPVPVSQPLAPFPDLTVSSLTVAATKLKSGDAATFSAVIANVAAGDAAKVAVRFLVDGVAVGADQSIAVVAAGASATVTASWP